MPESVTLVHAVGYGVVFAVYAGTTLHLAPRLWLRHFPANERDRQPARTRHERIIVVLHATAFLGGILLALPALSAWWVYGSGTDHVAVFRHVAWLGVIAALVDWLILDWLLIRFLQPDWIIPPGTSPESWRNTRDIVKDALGFFPIGVGFACGWGYVISRWILD